jgi:hypothetical protein
VLVAGETVLDPAGRQAGRPRTPPSWGPWRQLGRRSGVGAPANPWKNAGREAKESHRGAPAGSPVCRRPQCLSQRASIDACSIGASYRVQGLCVPPLTKRRSCSLSS